MYKNKTAKKQIQHYSDLYSKHHGTPMAVSSESLEHKKLRFEKISNIFENDNNFSVHDVGMGLSDFNDYINIRFPEKEIVYSGSDIVKEYVDESTKKFPSLSFKQRDLSESIPTDELYDYVVMSGVFHQMRNSTVTEWEDFYQNLLQNSFKIAKKGLAFNFVTEHVDFRLNEIYYCEIEKLIAFITKNLSRFFVIHHNYALYELTVHVFTQEFISEKYPQKEFTKYFKK